MRADLVELALKYPWIGEMDFRALGENERASGPPLGYFTIYKAQLE